MHTFTKGGARNLKAGGLHEKHAVYLLQVAKAVQAKQRTGRSVIQIAAEAMKFFFVPQIAQIWPAAYPGCLFNAYLNSFSRIKRPKPEPYHSVLSSVEVKNRWSFTPILTCSHVVDGGNFALFCRCCIQTVQKWLPG